MAYNLSRRATTNTMAPEEAIVQRALNEYCFEPSMLSADDFIPTKMLYARYRQYAKDRPDCPPHLMLNAQGFGVALRRVFDLDDGRKIKTRAGWGYRFVQGPGSLKLRHKTGRRRDPD